MTTDIETLKKRSGSALVVPAMGPVPTTGPIIAVQSAITIAVDTSYIAATRGQYIQTGVYMFDNRMTNGSTNEGALELHSKVNLGDVIGFNTVPINPNTGDTVVITGFQISQGSVFGNSGYPVPADPTDMSFWVGQAMNSSPDVTTYQIQVRVTVGKIRPVSYFLTWDPYITTK